MGTSMYPSSTLLGQDNDHVSTLDDLISLNNHLYIYRI